MSHTPDRLLLPRPLAVKLMHVAQLSPDAEICGLMSARDGTPHALYPVDNVADDPSRAFELDAQQHIDAMRRMREAGEASPTCLKVAKFFRCSPLPKIYAPGLLR